jgi:hypothetical protein
MVPLDNTNQQNELGSNPDDINSNYQDVRQLYQSTLNAIKPSVYETVFGRSWFSGNGIPDAYDGRRRDFHSTPTEHVQYLDAVTPGLIKKESTRQWMHTWEQHVRHNTATWHEPNRPKRL